MNAVCHLGYATLFRTVGAAEDLAAAFDTVTDDPGTAMRTGWRERVDRALEAIKHMRLAIVCCNSKGLVIRVSAVFTLFHVSLFSFRIVNVA